jgi:hypothetical protein
MKKIYLLISLMLSISGVYAQTGIEATSAITLSPFATATRMMESASVTALVPFASTMATIQARGVAGQEQLKDELAALNEDIIAGQVRSLDQVRQPTLKELFIEIEADEAQMAQINSFIDEGSKLHKLATAVTISLLLK